MNIYWKNPDIIFVIDRTKAIGGDTSQSTLTENELVQQTTAGKTESDRIKSASLVFSRIWDRIIGHYVV